MKKTKEEIVRLQYDHFLRRYGHLYDEEALNYIKCNFWDLIGDEVPDILMQVYTELGITHKNTGFYEEHIKKIKENFDIRSNILDVGSGCIPAFGNLVAKEQLRLGKGTVTICDPLLAINQPKYPNMKLIKQEFSPNANINNYDLITGILPCEATKKIIKAACENNKDFYIAMCGCVHYDGYPFSISPELYQKHIIIMAKEYLKKYDNGVLIEEYLDNKYSINYPIIYNKKS